MAGINLRAVMAEFLAMLLFVWICGGAATGVAGTPGWVQQVSLTFGFCIMVLAYTIGHHSGGQINCAVSLGLVVATLCGIPGIDLSPVQGAANFVAQMLGSLSGAALIAMCKDTGNDLTGGLATNTVGSSFESWEALIGEILGTFFLMYVVLETAVNPKSKANAVNAPFAIGMAVYLAHSILIPIDGCSINPTRSFGPAVVASIRFSDNSNKITEIWEDHWVFWLGPIIGSLFAVGLYKAMNSPKLEDDKEGAMEQEVRA